MLDTFKHFTSDSIALATGSLAVISTGVETTLTDGFIIHDLNDIPKIVLSLVIAVASRFLFQWINNYFDNKKKNKDEKRNISRN